MKNLQMIGRKARTHLIEGLNAIADAVGSTMGPGGRPFGYDKLGADMRLSASFSKDGLTVLRALRFDDQGHDAVLQYAKQAASNSVLASGDGTTSTIVLASAVANEINEASKKEGGLSPQYLARQALAEADLACELIRKEAMKSEEVVKQVALTSTNGDQELAEVVLDAIKNVGANGTVIVEKNPVSPVRYKTVRQDGYSNCLGYNYNQTFALSAAQEAASSKPFEWQNPFVLAWNGALIVESQVDPVLHAWSKAITSGNTPKSLVIVCFDISDEVANKLLVINRTVGAKHGIGVFVVKPRLSAETNSGLQVLHDISSFCGINEKHIVDGGNYKNLAPEFFGTCGKVRVSPLNTVFFGRAPDHWVIKRTEQNKSIIEEARSQFDKEITSIRNAELSEGLVKVEIGGGLAPDLQERADRFDDASKAAQSCMWHGALPGGGVSYIRAANLANVKILKNAFGSILHTVLDNYGHHQTPALKFDGEQGYKIDKDNILVGSATELGVLDACETVCAVIKNGVSLGVNIATLGGFSFRLGKEQD